jgi:DNA-3-methyladenine glycosylase II
MIEIPCQGPFDLALSARAARSFVRRAPTGSAEDAQEASTSSLKLGVWLDDRPTLIEVQQLSLDPPTVGAETDSPALAASIERVIARVVNAAMELAPFYEVARAHQVLGLLTLQLRGLKPFRPASLFDMLVMAVTEQQISLAAAHHIQTRLVQRFGAEVDGLPVFPRADALVEASLGDLAACGLSYRKAEYVNGVALAVATGSLDLEALETASDDEVRARISALRGFGLWSADYVLVRGLGRADAVPVDDLGVRRALGQLLSDGHVLSPTETQEALAPFEPYRGLATFYLLVGSRMGFPDAAGGPASRRT